jgi:hypothetical protein
LLLGSLGALFFKHQPILLSAFFRVERCQFALFALRHLRLNRVQSRLQLLVLGCARLGFRPGLCNFPVLLSLKLSKIRVLCEIGFGRLCGRLRGFRLVP